VTPRSIEALLGQPIWHVEAGPGTWPSLILALGAQRPRRSPLFERRHREPYRSQVGSHMLFVHCAWRLHAGDEVLVASRGEPHRLDRLESLVGGQVRAARTAAPAWDLTLELDTGHTLQVFADRALELENWILWTHDGCLEVGPGTAWETSAREV
jgi:hypothetical protein